MEEKSENLKYNWLNIDNVKYKTTLTEKFKQRKPYVKKNPKEVLSFIPGVIISINIKEKKKVKKGDILMILEAMKMKNQIISSYDGTVKKIFVKKGENVKKNQVLIEFA